VANGELEVANKFVEPPAQMVTSWPALTVGAGVTFTKTLAVAVHPFAFTVTVYVVEIVGEATGFDRFGLLNPVAGDQEKVALGALVNALRFAEAPEQIVVEFPGVMVTIGRGVTVTTTLEVAEQLLAFTVTVYVVVDVGDATGFAMFALLNPVDGDQEYVAFGAEDVANKLVDVPEQMETLFPAFTVGIGFTLTVTLAVAEHPLAAAVTV
jgi:hypothetical protein